MTSAANTRTNGGGIAPSGSIRNVEMGKPSPFDGLRPVCRLNHPPDGSIIPSFIYLRFVVCVIMKSDLRQMTSDK